jgi:hypothetical protein
MQGRVSYLIRRWVQMLFGMVGEIAARASGSWSQKQLSVHICQEAQRSLSVHLHNSWFYYDGWVDRLDLGRWLWFRGDEVAAVDIGRKWSRYVGPYFHTVYHLVLTAGYCCSAAACSPRSPTTCSQASAGKVHVTTYLTVTHKTRCLRACLQERRQKPCTTQPY